MVTVSSFRRILISTFIVVIVSLTMGASAQESGHYVSGGEGIKASTLPPEGFYYRNYFFYYRATDLRGESGSRLNVNLDFDSYAWVHRALWVTKKDVLGGDWCLGLVVPVVWNDFRLEAFDVTDRESGIADISFSPFTLSWHGKRWDAAAAYDIFIPNGEFDVDEPASVGKNFYTHMLTLGGTWYFDDEKKWHISALARYQIHTEKDDQDITPGDDFSFEWGIGRTFLQAIDVGIAGYCSWQVTDDHGKDVTWHPDDHDRVYSFGPEIAMFIPQIKTHFAFRHLWEFDAEDRPEGQATVLTVTKMF